MSRHVDEVAHGFRYLEGPRWYEGKLWLSDFYDRRIHTVDAQGNVDEVVEVPGQPSGLGWLPDGRMLIVSMRDHRIVRREHSGDLVVHADLSSLGLGGHLNDLVVGPTGRAYVGDFGFDLMSGAPIRTTRLYCVDTDGEVAVVADDLYFPNGMVLLPDSTLIVAETVGNRMTAFDAGTDGSLTNRRPWATFGDPPATDSLAEALPAAIVAPDGICADINGDVWVADALGNRVVHVREGGQILEEISTGELGTYACMLGGEDGRTLYLCAAPSFAEHERRDTRDAKLLSVRVDVPHGALP